MLKTKIVCTLGPSTDKGDILEQLVEAGMNVARFNFSHGDFEEHGSRVKRIRAARIKYGKSVAMLLDTKGPEIRIKTFMDGKIHLNTGDKFTLTTKDIDGDNTIVAITYKDLYKDVVVGGKILIDDGLIELVVEEIKDEDIICKVLNEGDLSDKKGVNVPGINLSLPYISEKDKGDILFAIREDYDYIAASFVRTAKDVLEVRKLLNENGGQKVHIVAKIENTQGVENIDEIIKVSDAIMIARGDMGVEIPCEEVPSIQKMIIKKVYEAGKIVITATQMLESMIKNPRPTRAETTDVANAIYDGTSAIMLSGETASGLYSVEALKTMQKIAQRTEEDIDYRKRFFNRDRKANPDITDAICHATCTTALDLNVKAILTVTKTGLSARMISRYRPNCTIIACTTDEKVLKQLNLSWGVKPILISEKDDVLELFNHSVEQALNAGLLEKDDTVVITSGIPLGISGTTNMIKVQTV